MQSHKRLEMDAAKNCCLTNPATPVSPSTVLYLLVERGFAVGVLFNSAELAKLSTPGIQQYYSTPTPAHHSHGHQLRALIMALH